MSNCLLSINRIATAIAIGLLPLSSQAFVPNSDISFGGGVTEGKSHVAITEDALLQIYKEYGFGDGLKPLTSSMKEAIKEIKSANASVDEDYPNISKYHCDADQLQQCSDLIRSEIKIAVNNLTNDSPTPSQARSWLGNAFHTLQDFYSHSNWVELGHTEPNTVLGKPASMAGVAQQNDTNKCRPASSYFNICDETNLQTTLLTSGYYSGQDQTYRYKAATADKLGMCRHGGTGDNTDGTGGINKDSSTCFLTIGVVSYAVSPHENSNPAAEALAIKATVLALRDIKTKVSEGQFKALLGFGPSLGFAIDTTGSMSGEIAGVKADASKIISERKGTLDEPLQYVLSPFNDPGTGPLTNTSNSDTFKSALASLSASGGDDCPELSMQGAYSAVAAMNGRGQVFGYTDASSKDASAQATLYSLAKEKDISISWALYGSCSPYDPAYFNSANRTGGQVFILPRGQTSGVSELANLLSRSSAADILSVAGQVSTTVTQNFPIDSTISRVTISVTSIESSSIVIKQPNGSIVKATDVGVKQIPFSPAVGSTVIYSITNPQVGQWEVSLQGGGDYSVLVNGDSTIALDKFDFVRLGGRPGHQGYYPIDGLPLAEKPQKAIARLSGKTQFTDFELRTKTGNVLQTLRLNSPGADQGDLLGDITTPTQSFLVYAVGKDLKGNPFQRVLKTQLIPQKLSVIPPIAVGLGKGQETTYIMQVKNEGISDTFDFAGLDDHKYVKSVTPSSAVIETNKTLNVKVVLQPSSTELTGTTDTLTFTAKSIIDPDVINSSVLVSNVVDPISLGDANRDGKLNCDDLNLVRVSFGSKTGNIAFNPAVDLDNNGIVDVRDLAVIARKVPAGTKCN